MSSNDKPLIGIIGGMGTAAGVSFQQLFFELCHSKGITRDQDYPEWIFFNASKTPDRTAAIEGERYSLVQYLTNVIRGLKDAGANAVLLTCNTVHAFYEEIYNETSLPWIHLQKETAKRLVEENVKQAGILATEGTVRTKLFSKAFSEFNLTAKEPVPGSKIQAKVTQAIYNDKFGIKHTGNRISEESKTLLYEAVTELNTDTIIAGCTELSLAFSEMDMTVKYYDPLKIAAEAIYDLWSGRRSVKSLD